MWIHNLGHKDGSSKAALPERSLLPTHSLLALSTASSFPFLSFSNHLRSYFGPLRLLTEKEARLATCWEGSTISPSTGTRMVYGMSQDTVFTRNEPKPWPQSHRDLRRFDLVEQVSTTDATHVHLKHVSASQITTKTLETSHYFQINCSPRELVISEGT